MEDFFKKINLLYRIGEKYEIEGQETVDVYFAKDEDSLNRICNAQNDEEMGLAYGFPETAARAFPNDAIDPRDIQEIEKDLLPFINFSITRSNWKKEIEIAKLWSETVRKNSPTLYYDILSEYRTTQLATKVENED